MYWILGLAGVFWWFNSSGSAQRWPDGQGPFDALPEDVVKAPIGIDQVTSTAGRQYEVTGYRSPSLGLIYYVAVRKQSSDWISYYFSPTTKVRTIGSVSFGTPQGRAELQADFGL